MDGTSVLDHTVVAHTDWVEARKDHMKREKELTRMRDEVERRATLAALARDREGLPLHRCERRVDATRALREP